MFDGVQVGRLRAETSVAGESHEFTGGGFESDYGEVALLLRCEPALHAFDAAGVIVVERGGVEDGVVEDFKDGLSVLLKVALDEWGHVDARFAGGLRRGSRR